MFCSQPATTALAHGDLHQRIEAMTRELELATNKAPIYLRRGELHRQHQDWESAQADFESASRLEPQLASIDLYRGRLLLEMGRYSDAKLALDRYLSAQTNDGAGYIVRAHALLQLAQRRAAADDLSRAIALLPDAQPDYFLERAQALAAENAVEEALRGLDEGMKRLGPVITLQQAAIDLEVSRRQYDLALKRLETILARVNRKELWLVRQGEILVLAGRPEEARKSFTAALKAIEGLPVRYQESQPIVELKQRIGRQVESLNRWNR